MFRHKFASPGPRVDGLGFTVETVPDLLGPVLCLTETRGTKEIDVLPLLIDR